MILRKRTGQSELVSILTTVHYINVSRHMFNTVAPSHTVDNVITVFLCVKHNFWPFLSGTLPNAG